MTKYTPGPWSITPEGITDSNIVAGDTTLATVYDTDLKQGRANLDLMVATPELLAACEEVLHYLNTLKDVVIRDNLRINREGIDYLIGLLKKPIAKAKGTDQ